MVDHLFVIWRVLACVCLASLLHGRALAQSPSAGVVLDGTLRPENAGLELMGPDVSIPAELGVQAGSNLFHSFELFNVSTGGSATFQDNLPGSAQSPIARILSRVTGGNASHIDGLLRSEIPGADLYLINPAGIVFGSGAQLDIGGSFHASTAHQLRLGASATFLSVDPGPNSPVTADLPSAFGFLAADQLPDGYDPRPAPIEVDGGTLAVPVGERLSLIGGDLLLREFPLDAPLSPNAGTATLMAEGGTIDLVAVASAGNVVLSEGVDGEGVARSQVALEGFSALGDIEQIGGGPLEPVRAIADAGGDPNGTIHVRGRNLRLTDGAHMTAASRGAANSQQVGIDLVLTGELRMESGSELAGSSFSSGSAGGLDITAQRIHLIGTPDLVTNFGSRAFSTGDAGLTRVVADEVVLENGGQIINNAVGVPGAAVRSSGNAGDLELDVGSLRILGDNSHLLNISFGGSIGSSGSITINAEDIVVDGQGGFAGISTQFGNFRSFLELPADGDQVVGRAGAITIHTGSLALLNNAEISSDVIWGAGDAGDISITASGVRLDNSSSIVAKNDALVPSGSFFAFLNPTGDAGNVTIDAGQIDLTNRSTIDVRSDAGVQSGSVELAANTISIDNSVVFFGNIGSGSGGSVDIDTGVLELTGGSLLAGLIGVDATGEPSNIVIRADRLVAADGSQIDTSTTGAIDAGDIRILDADEVSLSSGSRISSSSFPFRDNPNPGAAGTVEIEANRLEISDGGSIDVVNDSSAQRAGGRVILDVGDLDIRSGSIMANATGDADGGTIEIDVRGNAKLISANLTASVDRAQGGNVTIANADSLFLDGNSSITARAGAGAGGNIALSADVIVIDPGAVISADSETGVDGVVTISSLKRSISGTLENLPVRFQESAALLRSQCGSAVDAEGQLALSPFPRPSSTPSGLLLVDGFELLPSQVREGSASPLLNAGGSELLLASVAAGPSAADSLLRSAGSLRSAASIPDSLSERDRALSQLEGYIGEARRSQNALELANAHWARARVYDRFEDYESSRRDLEAALKVALNADAPALAAHIAIELARASALDGDSEQMFLWLERARTNAKRTRRPLVAAQIESQSARILLDLGESDAAGAAIERARKSLGQLLPSANAAYLSIHLAASARRLSVSDADARTGDDKDRLLAAFGDLKSAARIAMLASDDRALSFALGNLAELYLEEGRFEEALELTRSAQSATERADDRRDGYRWSWQAARELWGLGRATDAIDSYERALSELHAARPADQIVFGRESLPEDQLIYRELLSAYFESVDRLETGAGGDRLLRRALRRFEELKRAELRSYYRDECVAERAAKRQLVASIDRSAAVLYPIILADRVELLVEIGDSLERRTLPISSAELALQTSLLRKHLEIPIAQNYRSPARNLYAALIEPIEPLLAKGGVETLVIVPDGVLRTIPFAALHDGERFLVERFAIAVVPGLELVDPKPMDIATQDVLLVGLSESIHGYPAIEGAEQELLAIQDLYGGRVWMNQAFERSRFDAALGESPPGIVHIASHGRFTGDPSTSFLLTYDGRLTMKDLEGLVSRSKYSNEPVEMLVLSACQTAIGDDRAALGLAGVAVRAGARSALGSLWQINDLATRDLIIRFYEELGKEGQSKAKALQRAQIAMLAGKYRHPSYWSPFLLISNWL